MTNRPSVRAPGAAPGGDRARRAADRAKIDEVFGETFPETTSDEARGRDGRVDDDWWRDQLPPHHG